jgi:hypothetical protein
VGLLSYAYGIISGGYLTRSKYLELAGAALTPDLYEAPTYEFLGELERRDGYTRRRISVRLFDDPAAIESHPELANLRNVRDELAKATDETDFQALTALYEKISLLHEGVQYGHEPFSLEDLKNGKITWTVNEAKAFVDRLYQDTLRFYTHTEAYVLTPDDMLSGEKRPAILVHHQHNAEYALGKSEPAGVTPGGAPNQATGLDLVHQGYVVVAYDQPGFESRQHPVRTGLQWERWRSHGLEQQGKSLLGMQLAEAVKMVSFVESLPNVDKGKIGAYGHSLGAWMTANLAAIDDRIKVAVVNCGFPTIVGLNMLPAQYHCEPHGIPGLGKYGFDFPSIFDLRGTKLRLHMNFGGSDALNSEHGIVTRGIQATANRWGHINFSRFVDPLVVHKNTPAMLTKTLGVFSKGFEALGYRRNLIPLGSYVPGFGTDWGFPLRHKYDPR